MLLVNISSFLAAMAANMAALLNMAALVARAAL